MEEKIKLINDFFQFITDFNNLLKNNPVTIFKCENNEFEKKYSVFYLNLKKFYKFVKGIDLQGTCSQKFLDNYYEIKNITLAQIINLKNMDHKLKKNNMVYDIPNSKHGFYSHESKDIDNEVMEAIYKKYGASAFDYYDVNWRSKEQLTVEVFKEATTKENLKAFFKPEFSPVTEVVAEPIKEEVKEVVAEQIKTSTDTEKSKEQMEKDFETLKNSVDTSVKLTKPKQPQKKQVKKPSKTKK